MYNTIKLEKGLYNIAGKSFTQALEEMDKDSNYENTELKGLDAFERQLKRFDIKVSGSDSDMVEKFFQTTDSAVLFPEFVRRAIKQGIEEASILSEVVCVCTQTNGVDYRALSVVKTGNDTGIAEGGTLPTTTIKLSSNSTALVKLGRKISTSYEAIRQKRLDIFAVTLKTIGAQISRAININAMQTLIDGASASATAGELTYNDLITFWSSFEYYNLTTILVSPAIMAEILKFDEMKKCVGEYMTSGMIQTPFGATLIKSNGISDSSLIGLDKSCALEMIFGSDVIVDFDKLIGTQIDDTAFSITTGFSKILADATRVLNIS